MGLHHLTVREWNFSVHFTLHRFQQTVGKETNCLCFRSVIELHSLAFFTSEAIHNERVSSRRRYWIELFISTDLL